MNWSQSIEDRPTAASILNFGERAKDTPAYPAQTYDSSLPETKFLTKNSLLLPSKKGRNRLLRG